MGRGFGQGGELHLDDRSRGQGRRIFLQYGFTSYARRRAQPEERYDKQVLVPFGEYVPYPFKWMPGLSKLVGPIGNFSSGDRSHVFSVTSKGLDQSVRIGPLICYEDIFPSLSVGLPSVKASICFLFLRTTLGLSMRDRRAACRALCSSALEVGRPFLRCGNAGWSVG